MGRHSGHTRKVAARSKSKAQPQGAAIPLPRQPGTKTSYRNRVPVVRALLRGGEWSRPDTLTAIGLAVAIIGIITPILISINHSSPAGPDLKTEDVEIALASNIDASNQAPGDPAPSAAKDTGSAIDITLRNSGNEPALIVKAVFSFMRVTELDSCPGGAGDVVSSAEYDVKVPTAKSVSANDPLVLDRDMRFAVNANSIDRFRISVGPNQYSSTDWIYEFNLSLVEDDGQNLDLGPMSILGFSTPSGVPFLWDQFHDMTPTDIVIDQDASCVAHDVAELSHALANPGLHSPELQTMYREAEGLTSNPPACLQIPTTENPNGCPVPRGMHTFFTGPFGVVLCSETIEVSGNYNCLAAENIAKDYEEAKAPKVVSMTFKSDLLMLPMKCLPAGRAEVCRSTDDQELEVGFIP
jgi:hypothetical protein